MTTTIREEEILAINKLAEIYGLKLVLHSQPDNDGWIEWRGGPCPVDANALVDVRHKGNPAEWEDLASEWDWDEVSHYRLHKPAPDYPALLAMAVDALKSLHLQALQSSVADAGNEWGQEALTEARDTLAAIEKGVK